MLNDQFTFGANVQHSVFPFNSTLYLNVARTCSELVRSVKGYTGPVRSAVDPYELELEKLLSLLAFNAESCAYALENFPGGIQWHSEGLQCNHEICALGFLTYAAVELSPETPRSDIPWHVWYRILYQDIILHQVWGLNNTEFQPNEAAMSLRKLGELFSPVDREQVCPDLMQHIELLKSAAAGNVQQSEGDNYLSDVVARELAFPNANLALAYVKADFKDDRTGEIIKGKVTYDGVDDESGEGDRTLRMELYKGRIAKCL